MVLAILYAFGVCQWGIYRYSSERFVKDRASPKNPVKRNSLENKSEIKEFSSADHRLLGRQLDLFSTTEDVGVGLVLWHPKGDTVCSVIRDFWEQMHLKSGYQLVNTPHIAREGPWRISGHLDYNKDNMYVFEKENEGFVVKPMNCPFHIMVYKDEPRSYKELIDRLKETRQLRTHEVRVDVEVSSSTMKYRIRNGELQKNTLHGCDR